MLSIPIGVRHSFKKGLVWLKVGKKQRMPPWPAGAFLVDSVRVCDAMAIEAVHIHIHFPFPLRMP